MMRPSVLILAQNEAENIGRCLEAVFSQKYSQAFEVIVVDSGSTDETVEIARQYPVRLVQIPAREFQHGRTRNYAASLARGEFLVYLAADAFPASEDWLESLLAPFADPAVAAVYGRHLPRPNATGERVATFSILYGDCPLVKDRSRKRELGYRCYHFSTVNAALRRSVWEMVKFPDVKVFEDLAIAKNLIDAGWKIVYEPRAAVYHSHSHSPEGLLKRYFDIAVSWRRLGIWDADLRASFVRDAWKLVSGGGSLRVRGNGQRPRGSLWLTAAKFAGFALGLNERFLPRGIKRRLSAFQLFD